MGMDGFERDATPSRATAHVAAHASTWPSPLLEPILGAAWRIAGPALAGGVLLVAPVLYRLTGGPEPTRAPDDIAHWVPELISVAGLPLLALAAWRGRKAFVAARSALGAGHGRLTVLEAAAARSGDKGWVTASELERHALYPEARTILRAACLAASALALVAAMLPICGFLATVLLAYAGAVDARSAWLLTFRPLPVVGGLALAALALESIILSVPRRRWAADAAAALAPPVAAWTARLEAGRRAASGRGRPGGAGALRVLSSASLLIVIAATAYALLFGIVAFRGRAVVRAATPMVVDGAAARIAGGEAARPSRLPADPAISAEAAGEALHALATRSETRADPRLRAPVRSYGREPQRPAGRPPFATPVPGADWVRAAAAGLTPDQAAYLRALAADPAAAEISTLARAGSIDIVGTRYVTPFPATAIEWELPIPATMGMRAAVEAQFARALLALDAGRAGEPELPLREILSAGVLLADEAPSIIDALMGVHAAALGLGSLGALYEGTGRSADATHIARLSDAVRRAAAIVGGAQATTDAPPQLAATSARVLDPNVPRALRWQLASARVAMSECGSLRHRLFGESAAYREWKEKARAALVRSPGEEALFDLMLESPVRGDFRARATLGHAAALAAHLIPGGPRCSPIWAGI